MSIIPAAVSNDASYISKYQRHLKLKQLNEFTPVNMFAWHLISKHTDTHLIHDLIHKSQQAQYFTISTTHDFRFHTPAVIQIEIMRPKQSIVFMVQCKHLPYDQKSVQFWLIKSLIRAVLTANKKIYIWGNVKTRLTPFLHTNLFDEEDLNKPIFENIQDEYRQFDYQFFGRFRNGKQPWSLQVAVADLLCQFLDQSQVFNMFNRCFDRPIEYLHLDDEESLVNYLVNQCLAVTKMAYNMDKEIFRFIQRYP